MHSFFKSRTRKKSQPSSTPDRPAPPSTTPTNQQANPTSFQSTVDELGRTNKLSLTSSHQPPSINPSHQRNQASDSSSHVSKNPTDPSELQLIYGYIGLYTDIELDLHTTNHAVHLIAKELKLRALETPLLFSTNALDISTEGTHSLIKSFVTSMDLFVQDIPIHGAHNLAAFLKWILSRHVNSQGTHGFLQWEKYASWRESEKAFGYPLRFLSTNLLSQISPLSASLLLCLLDLFASASVRADTTGMTIHKCGALFGAYIFGLEDDQPFEKTYSNWLRYSHATEHLVFAYMRDLKAQSPTGKIPLRMESCIKGYPSIIPCLFKTHASARLERVARFRRLTGLYSKNLVFTAGTWNVPRSKTWDRLKPYPEISAAQYLNRTKAGCPNEPFKLLYSPFYKHLLNIRANLNFEDDVDDYLGANFEGPQRFKSLVEKEWSGFLTHGFQEPDAKKLQFNLDESSIANLKMKRDTMDWDAFTGSGFIGRETYRPADLAFNSNIQMSSDPPPSSWPATKRGISKKLIKTSRSPPLYPFDTTPTELPLLYIDENFFEAWADVLIGSGWSHDELKEVSWVLVHCKCKPADYLDYEFRPTPLNPDGRHEDIWALFEELMPPDVRNAQFNAPKSITQKRNRRSFLRVITGKDSKKSSSAVEKLPSLSEVARPYYPNAPDSFLSSACPSKPVSLSSPFVPDRHAPDSSLAMSAPSTPQSNPMNLFRSISRLRHHGNTSITASDIRHPAHMHQFDIDTHSIDELSLPCTQGHSQTKDDNWVNVTVSHNPPHIPPSLRTGQSFEYSPESFKRYNQSASPSLRAPTFVAHSPTRSAPASPSPDSSRACTPTSDHDGLLHDSCRSDISRSVASSSDFTVELAERLPEGSTSMLRPPSLIPVRTINPTSPLRINPPTIRDSSRASISDTAHELPNALLTPRFKLNTQDKVSPTWKTPSSQNLSPKTPSPESSFLKTPPKTPPKTPSPKTPDTNLPSSLKSEPTNQYYVDQENALQEQRKLQQNQEQKQAQQLEQIQKLREKLQQQQQRQLQRKQNLETTKPQPISKTTQPKQLVSTPSSRPDPSTPSPSIRNPTLEKADLNAPSSPHGTPETCTGDEDWFASLKSHVNTNAHKTQHFSNQPILPPQFDLKARKVSNIVDLFEKAQPSDLHSEDSSDSVEVNKVRSISLSNHHTTSNLKPKISSINSATTTNLHPHHRNLATSSPVRIPIRTIKLSRVGEQDEI